MRVVNDLHRAMGRSGVGAVMGSKNLKAVAIRGPRCHVADPAEFQKVTAEKKAVLTEMPSRARSADLWYSGPHECDQRTGCTTNTEPQRR